MNGHQAKQTNENKVTATKKKHLAAEECVWAMGQEQITYSVVMHYSYCCNDDNDSIRISTVECLA